MEYWSGSQLIATGLPPALPAGFVVSKSDVQVAALDLLLSSEAIYVPIPEHGRCVRAPVENETIQVRYELVDVDGESGRNAVVSYSYSLAWLIEESSTGIDYYVGGARVGGEAVGTGGYLRLIDMSDSAFLLSRSLYPVYAYKPEAATYWYRSEAACADAPQ